MTLIFLILVMSAGIGYLVIAESEDCKTFYSPNGSTEFKVCNPSDYEKITQHRFNDSCIELMNVPIFKEINICDI